MEKKLSDRFLEKHIAEFEINSMASGMFISEYDAKIYGEICIAEARLETAEIYGNELSVFLIKAKLYEYERKYDL